MNRYLVDEQTLRALLEDAVFLRKIHELLDDALFLRSKEPKERVIQSEVAVAVTQAILDAPPVSVQAIGKSLHTGPARYVEWTVGGRQ